ncbi:cobalamin biosynthesis protein [Pseudonocardia zijingensis]|uniref:cobalamin biosynthesis protein n=2 Tax=Pseudonocardia zijingensis TaxID=153376 RepID=UPI00361A7990
MGAHWWVRPAGLLLGALADAVIGDPRRGHPVAGFGRVAAAVESRCYADRRAAGVLYTGLLVGGAAALGVLAERVTARRPLAGVACTALATWAVLGGSSLAGHGSALARELTAGDLPAARTRLPALCGRDPAALDAAGMARAGTESMAENTSDAVVAPLLWGAVAGVPGLLAYRAVNTLDAMVGYRSARYRRFGWAAARLDDVANLGPARVSALLVAALAPAVGGSPRAALGAWRRDGAAHPSPNAGPVEAAAAGALGVTLGGRTVYPHGVEERPRLGTGPAPAPADLARAARLSRLVGAAAAVLAAGLTAAIARTAAARRRAAAPARVVAGVSG